MKKFDFDSLPPEAKAEFARLENQRDELLAACKQFLDYYESGMLDQFSAVHAAIRAAVAKAEDKS